MVNEWTFAEASAMASAAASEGVTEPATSPAVASTGPAGTGTERIESCTHDCAAALSTR
jgi:hypothetical protein